MSTICASKTPTTTVLSLT